MHNADPFYRLIYQWNDLEMCIKWKIKSKIIQHGKALIAYDYIYCSN